MWDMDLAEDGKLILSGTLSLVFRGTQGALQSVLEVGGLGMGPHTDWISAFIENTTHNDDYYLKVEVFGAGAAGNSSSQFAKRYRHVVTTAELLATYPIHPFSQFIFMRNRGKRVNAETFSDMTSFVEAFAPVWETAMHLCRVEYYPCDTLPHNLVYDGTHLHLIDINEGVFGRIIRRPPPTDTRDKNWLEAVRYPNYYCRYPWVYTLLQLSFTVYVMVSKISTSTLAQNQTPAVKQIEQSLSEVGKHLMLVQRKHGDDDASIPPHIIQGNLNILYQNMVALLQVPTPVGFEFGYDLIGE